MAKLIQLQQLLSNNLITEKEQASLKGKGMGNMLQKDGKNCPPPVEEGKLSIAPMFL